MCHHCVHSNAWDIEDTAIQTAGCYATEKRCRQFCAMCHHSMHSNALIIAASATHMAGGHEQVATKMPSNVPSQHTKHAQHCLGAADSTTRMAACCACSKQLRITNANLCALLCATKTCIVVPAVFEPLSWTPQFGVNASTTSFL